MVGERLQRAMMSCCYQMSGPPSKLVVALSWSAKIKSGSEREDMGSVHGSPVEICPRHWLAFSIGGVRVSPPKMVRARCYVICLHYVSL